MVSFEFEPADDYSARKYKIHECGSENIHVYLERRLCRSVFHGMKQPIPNGAMLGLGALMTVKYKGKRAFGIWWKLFEKNTLVHEGHTNEGGHGWLPIGSDGKHRLEIIEPLDTESEPS